MNIFDPDIHERIVAVDGHDDVCLSGECSLESAQCHVRKLQSEGYDHGDGSVAQVYSFGGFHRWLVYANGEVKFSHSHRIMGDDKYTERAIEQGFDIHW